MTLRDMMSRPIVYCYLEKEAKDAVRIMKRHAIARLPMVTRQKRIVGTVWLSDVSGEVRSQAHFWVAGSCVAGAAGITGRKHAMLERRTRRALKDDPPR
jgi:CBS-domain-containing membrane protein